ncbi:MAG TPA: hypothetical protein VKT30_19885 [Caulobacteraceae bacterium]|nr:hypothetical protein [Caulobacteraceae bacterium]
MSNKLNAVASALALICLVGGTTLALASATPVAAATGKKGHKVVKHHKTTKTKVTTGGYG